MNKNLRLIIFLAPIIPIVGLCFYIHMFNGRFSPQQQDWSSFGSYMGFFVNLASLLVLLFFSYMAYQYNDRKDKELLKRENEFKIFQQALENPVLTFSTFPVGSSYGWKIGNVGNGAALNLLVCYKNDAGKDWIAPLVRCYSLGKGESIILRWIKGGADIIGVHYKDTFENEFVSIVGNDTSVVRPYVEGFKDIVIDNFTYTKKDFDVMLAVRRERLLDVITGRANNTTTDDTTRRD